MTHLLVIMLFAGLVAIVFAAVTPEVNRSRALYGLKVFAEFVGVGLLLAWILYFLPL